MQSPVPDTQRHSAGGSYWACSLIAPALGVVNNHSHLLSLSFLTWGSHAKRQTPGGNARGLGWPRRAASEAGVREEMAQGNGAHRAMGVGTNCQPCYYRDPVGTRSRFTVVGAVWDIAGCSAASQASPHRCQRGPHTLSVTCLQTLSNAPGG